MQDDPALQDDAAVEEVARHGPSGTWAVAGVATFIVVAIYFLFYFFVFLPRGVIE